MATGRGRFFGQATMCGLQAGGADQIFVPRPKDSGMRTKDGIDRALGDARSQMINHLTVVSGTGAHRENPAGSTTKTRSWASSSWSRRAS